jgi:hypothetical protein
MSTAVPLCRTQLAAGDVLAGALLGPVRAGKSRIFRELWSGSGGRDIGGVVLYPADDSAHLVTRDAEEGKATSPGKNRERPAILGAIPEGRQAPFSMMLLDLAGEEFKQNPDRAESDEILSWGFLSELDLIVFAVPPFELTSLREDRIRIDSVARERARPADAPEDPSSSGFDEQKRRFNYVHYFAQLKRVFADCEKPRTVVFALTKCDRYRDVKGFPQEFLEAPAAIGGADARAWQQETGKLMEFMARFGAMPMLNAASRLFSDYSVVAVSGTGRDYETPQERAGLEESSNPGDGAPGRALDPYLIAWDRRSLVCHGTKPAGETSRLRWRNS